LRSNSQRSRFSGRRPKGIAFGLLIALVTSSYAIASGWAPFASEDAATVTRGGTVTVLNSGFESVLDNDWDIERDPLTAFLTHQAKHGDLILNSDGTFVYQHNGDAKKDDEFRYRAFDGTGYSRDARVRIKIEKAANNSPFVVGSPPNQEAVEGTPYLLALASYFGDLDEGDRLRYSANGLPGSLRIDRDSGVLAGTPSAADARDTAYTAVITATDNGGLSASLTFQLIIYPDSRADLKVTAGVAVNPVTVGEAAQWTINVENLGPADLDTGELVAQWITSGPILSLTVPQNCSVSGNNSKNPSLRCSLDGLVARTDSTFNVQATQNSDGDYSLIAIVVADDPILDNNSDVAGAQVVAAFSEGPTQILNTAAGGLVSADLDGDGLYDVVATTATNTIVYFNGGNRSLSTPGTSLGTDSGGSAIVILDWNGDGNPDVAVAGTFGLAARVYVNDGNGALAEKVDLGISNIGSVRAAAAADFDRDGNDDLALTSSNGSVLLLSSGGSAYSTRSLPAGAGIDIAVADLNNDSFQDIVIIQAADRSVRLLRNAGNGRDFNSQTLQRGSVAGVSATDLNADGRVDLLLAIDGEDLELPESRILMQRSDGSFPAGTKIGASPLRKMLAGDVDGDLLPDVIAINDAGVHQLYLGMPGGGFDLNPEQIVSDGMRRGVLIDFNNDSSLDLILAGRDAGVIEIHANNGIGRMGLGDRVAPVISLNGEASVILAAGEEYEDPGATATDDIDGDLTDSVETIGSYNSSVVGTYTVSYAATDRAGNKATVQRIIKVGVNEGVGGGGGGVISPLMLLLQLLLAVAILRRRYLHTSS